jgi:hypothetical protein
MLALNKPVALVVERYGHLAYRLVEDEIERAMSRGDDATADAWKDKLLEVTALLREQPVPGLTYISSSAGTNHE